MNAMTEFYQTLSSMSFTLLGLWFGVMQFAHGGWRSDPQRHRPNLHIALHFLLPGFMGLGALLSGDADGGALWRIVFVIGGMVGVVESLSFLQVPGRPFGLVGQFLLVADIVLDTLIVMAALLPVGLFAMTPLQMEGVVVALLFLCGLCYIWLAFAERAPADPPG